MNGKIPDKDRYDKAWTHHIKEIVHLALAADISYREMTAVRDELLRWKDKAIENLYTEESNNGKV